ncbi:MAG: hypothetical protein HQ478_07380 [Chloroflexi bacterium]|nr:hypothetical protein [Chloroflexota bacterium]
MTNAQIRLIGAAIALVGGAIAASTDNLNVNVGLAIIIVSAAIFLFDSWRLAKD